MISDFVHRHYLLVCVGILFLGFVLTMIIGGAA